MELPSMNLVMGLCAHSLCGHPTPLIWGPLISNQAVALFN